MLADSISSASNTDRQGWRRLSLCGSVCSGWVLGNMVPFFFLLKMVNFLRVPAEEETLGLDESYHGASQSSFRADSVLLLCCGAADCAVVLRCSAWLHPGCCSRQTGRSVPVPISESMVM